MIVSWALFLGLAFALWLVNKTPWARVLRAIREDEDAARALGKNTLVCKLQSLSVAAALAADRGLRLRAQRHDSRSRVVRACLTIFGYVVIILGGLGSYFGVIFGSVILLTLIEGTRFLDLPLSDERVAALRFVLVGLVLIALIAFRPQGVFGKREEMVLHD